MTREEEMALLVREIEALQRELATQSKVTREEIKARRERLHQLAHDVGVGQTTLADED
jgi:hypothetical protein